jgi:hypothetical protein
MKANQNGKQQQKKVNKNYDLNVRFKLVTGNFFLVYSVMGRKITGNCQYKKYGSHKSYGCNVAKFHEKNKNYFVLSKNVGLAIFNEQQQQQLLHA